MTTSSSSRSDDALIPAAPATVGGRIPSLHVLTRPAPLLNRIAGAQAGEVQVGEVQSAAAVVSEAQCVGARTAEAQSAEARSAEALRQDSGRPYADPLHGLVHAAVAGRPLEDVVRLITLLERSPEHARTTADALRAAAVDRSVEDVTRLVTLLTEPPRETHCADEAIRAAAECRSVEDVSRLMQLLHRTPVEPHCAEEAVRAAAVNRPLEELAELIDRMAADRARCASPLPDVAGPLPAGPTADPGSPAAEAIGAQGGHAKDRPAQDGLGQDRPAKARPPRTRPDNTRPDKTRRDRNRAAKAPSAEHPAPDGRSSAPIPLWGARGAALLVALCGVAHAPRYWAGLSRGVLGATVVVSALCLLLALALPARAAWARIVVATVAFGVTGALGAGQVLGGRFGLPDASRLLLDATLAPLRLAGVLAGLAAVAALGVMSSVVTGAKASPRRRAVRQAGGRAGGALTGSGAVGSTGRGAG
ncbi:hypothetical protein ACIHEJ_29285 [Streptomyces sp. NPDC052301]|uniref:hypothetical protein n=1 Tax=Streptomyces sp. NPDC052301 TaxID=3365687 RepID=UPI0037D86F31